MAAEAPAGVRSLDLGEGGTALLYVPAGQPVDRPSPLVVLFHGAGGTAEDGLGLLRICAESCRRCEEACRELLGAIS